MNPFRYILLGFLLFTLSEIILIYFRVVKVYFLLFIPIFISSSPLSIIPFIFFIIPFILMFSANWREYRAENLNPNEFNYTFGGKSEREVNYGGFIFIGPVPIVFGKGMNKRTLFILIIIMLVIMVLFILFSR